jgi:hypothetical protein
MSHTAPLPRIDVFTGVSCHLHLLVRLLQRVSGLVSGHAVFFDALRAVLIDSGAAPRVDPATQDHSLLAAIGALERRPLGHDPLVFDLLQELRVHGYLEGEPGTRLAETLRGMVARHLRLFWQEFELPQTVPAASETAWQRGHAIGTPAPGG